MEKKQNNGSYFCVIKQNCYHTLAQCSTEDKSNEIPTVQKMLKELNIKGTMITADALNCQKETAEIIVKQKADYLFFGQG